MKILFSPSEAKISGGSGVLSKENFIFPELFEDRLFVIDNYIKYVSSLNDEELKKFFGLKDNNLVNYHKENILNVLKKPILKAINRYDGVAYKYLEYNSLSKEAQNYIDENVVIFSNLFGPILAKNKIPNYKFKQGSKIRDFSVEKFYKDKFSKNLDEFLEDDILDLRANFYEKFYKIKKPYFVLKFIKNNKVVSHYAKAYRGIILRELAVNNIQTFDEFLDLKIEKLSIKEIKKQKQKTEIVFEIGE